MAESAVSLQTITPNNLRETENLLQCDQEAPTSTLPCHCGQRYRARRVRSKGAVLVIVWSLLTWACSTIVNADVIIQSSVFKIMNGLGTAVLYLFTGWLADVYFGRYKVMKVSIWVMWIGNVCGTLLLLIHFLSPHDVPKYVSIVVAYIGAAIGSSGLIINAIPFGTDQMLGASSEEISSFIHWFIWAMYTGIASGYFMVNGLHCTSMSDSQTSLVSVLFAVAVSSVALCLDFLCRNWLVVEPVSQNPLKSIYSVLKYAASHKHPARRSALTYWEEDIPSRIDLGKSKYGGPFTTEQVEDVKTFFRLLVVSVAISFFVYPLISCNFSLSMFASHFQQQTTLFRNKDANSALLDFFTFAYVVVIFGIPLYELVIYPLARNWIPSTLKRVGIGAFGTIIVASVALSADMVGHAHTNATVECMFVENRTSSSVVDVNFLWVGIVLGIAIGIEVVTIFAALFEFLCAQTPHSMKGLIIGLSFASAVGLSQVLANATFTTWTHAWSPPVTYPTCAFWFYLFIIVVTVVGLVMFGIVAKCYKKRERDDVLHEQKFVEDYYNKYIQ